MRLIIFMLLSTLFAGSAMADSIKNTKHNFSVSGTGSVKAVSETRICVFCHTPHNAKENIPLWNRSNPGDAYATYAANNSNFIQGDIPDDLAPDSISRFCISCHDDINATGDNVGAGVIRGGAIEMNGVDMRAMTKIGGKGSGNGLRDDHPMGFTVLDKNDGGGDPEIKDKTTWDMPLYESENGINQIECPTCHDPHIETLLFLRSPVANIGCLACHDKCPPSGCP